MQNSNKDYIFMPMSIEQASYDRENYFLSPKKIIQFIVGLMISLAIIAMFSGATHSIGGLIIGIVLALVFMFYFMRLAIMEESKWKKVLSELKKNQLSDHTIFWGIDRVSKDGVIDYYYSKSMTIKRAIVIKLLPGSKVGRSEDFEAIYENALSGFFQDLTKEGFSRERFEMLEKKKVPDNVNYMQSMANNMDSSIGKNIAKAIITNVAIKSKHAQYIEVDYFVIYNTNSLKMKKFRKRVESIISRNLTSNFFKYVKVLDRDEVMDFLKNTLQINALSGNAVESSVPFSKYGEIFRIFDLNGNELFIDDISDLDNEQEDEQEELDDLEKLELEMNKQLNNSSDDSNEDVEQVKDEYEEPKKKWWQFKRKS